MILYIIVALWPLFMLCSYKSRQLECGEDEVDTQRLIYIIWAALPMFFLIGFRHENLGADTIVYMRNFREIQTMSLQEAIDSSRMEDGYIIFVKYVGKILPSAELFQIFYASIYMVGYVSFAKNLKGVAPFYFLFFVITLGSFTFMFTGVRQCLAISICLFSYQFLIQKKYWIFISLLFLAYNFHKSSLLFIFPFFMWNRPFNWKYLVFYVFLLYLVSTSLLSIQNRMNETFEYNYEIEATGNGGIFLFIMILLTIISYRSFFSKDINQSDVLPLFNINIITLFFWVLRLQTRVAERPSYYFLPISCALFSYMMLVNSKYEVLRYAIIFFSLALYVYRLSTNFADLIPYRAF